MRRPTGRPVGRPWKLTPEQEARVYAAYNAANHGKRYLVLSELAREFHCAVSTLEKVVTRHRAKQPEIPIDTFHVDHINSGEISP